MELREYLLVLRRYWWVWGITALVAAAAAFAFARAQTPIYRSSVRLEVTGRIDYGQVLAIDRLLRQIAARITTTPVAEAVDERLKLDLGAPALLGKIRTQVFPDTIHIQVDVDDVDPTRTERIAATIAEVVQERQRALMASVPDPERINIGAVDRPSPARLIAPQTRSSVLAMGLLGLLAGIILAFLLDSFGGRAPGPPTIPSGTADHVEERA